MRGSVCHLAAYWRDFAEKYRVAMLVKRHGCGMWQRAMGGT